MKRLLNFLLVIISLTTGYFLGKQVAVSEAPSKAASASAIQLSPTAVVTTGERNIELAIQAAIAKSSSGKQWQGLQDLVNTLDLSEIQRGLALVARMPQG